MPSKLIKKDLHTTGIFHDLISVTAEIGYPVYHHTIPIKN
jgi:hypothetical protein